MRNSIKKYTVAVIAVTAMIATPGCTDSWNEHFGDSAGSGKSVWELVNEDPDLTSFASLVKQARYYRDEKHDQPVYTFDKLLDGNRTVCVWAPTNDALANELDALKQMAIDKPYDFQRQFIMNHIAFGKYNMNQLDTVQRFRLINNKYATIDPSNDLFGTAKVVGKNIPARNGLLNTVSNMNSFDNNVYEYIKFTDNTNLATEQEYITSRDTIYYKPGSSIYGYPDEYGDPTVIDSVFSSTDNLLFGSKGKNSYLPLDYKYNDVTYKYMSYEKMFNIDINNEDSVYAMLTLTDAALNDGANKMNKLYKYAQHYPNMERMKTSSDKATYLENVTLNVGNTDSLRTFNERGLMYATSVFNLNLQPKDLNQGATWTKETFAEYRGKNCKYLLNTYGDTLRLDPAATTIDTQKDQSSMFVGCESIIGSNGVSFLAKTWNYPASYYNPTIDINLNAASYRWSEYSATGDKNTLSLHTISNDTLTNMYKTICEDGLSGIVRNNFVYTGNETSSAAHDIYFTLRDRTSYGTQVMAPSDKDVASTHYNIDVVLVPYYLLQADTIPTSSEDTLYNKLSNQFSAKLYKYNPDTCPTCAFADMETVSSDVITYNGEKVQKVRLFSNVEFPVSYRDMIYTYPLLEIKSTMPKKPASYTKAGWNTYYKPSVEDPTTCSKLPIYTYTLCIDRIILTPVN